MLTKHKLILEEAISTALDKIYEEDIINDYYEGYLHVNLVSQMATASEMVFDSSHDGQKTYKNEAGA